LSRFSKLLTWTVVKTPYPRSTRMRPTNPTTTCFDCFTCFWCGLTGNGRHIGRLEIRHGAMVFLSFSRVNRKLRRWGCDIEKEKASRGSGQAGGWSGRIARQRVKCGSSLALSNVRSRPKRQQAARSRDIRNIQATADEAAKAPRPLNCPLLGHFRLPSLLSQPWDGGTMVVRWWCDGGAILVRYWYDIGTTLVRRCCWGGHHPWLPIQSSHSVGF
jgi:hypothetical protein